MKFRLLRPLCLLVFCFVVLGLGLLKNVSPAQAADRAACLKCPAPEAVYMPGYSDAFMDCPFGTDLSKNCCRWIVKVGVGFGTCAVPGYPIQGLILCYDVKPKVACDASPAPPPSFKICEQAGNLKAACNACYGGGDQAKGIWTAVGCIETGGNGIITSLLRVGLGMIGGIVLLIILAASFRLTTSRGDPKGFEEARSMLTAGISGLLFVIFSMVLLRTIGIQILRIPGF